MRYYNFVLNSNEELIKEKATIKLRDYGYGSTLQSLNGYLHQKMKNDICFFAYREDEGNAISAVFSFNERKYSLRDTYYYIMEMLREAFRIKRIKEEPCEITMYQFMECLDEAKRREYVMFGNKVIEIGKLWMYYWDNAVPSPRFDFKEKIISLDDTKQYQVYHEQFRQELRNIEKHGNNTRYSGNLVHYVISGRSMEATSDMVEALMQRLFKANRIGSRRMEIISEIEPDVYKVNNYMEEIIENNYGGVVVFDLSEKFGCDPVNYGMASKYIEKLVKKYHKECLFIFTYNMEQPGFSYLLLPNLKKYVIPIMLREGTCNRASAILYIEDLIRKSEYRQYAFQAREFLELYPGEKFTQSELLAAYEQFEAWCLNKNILRAYDYNLSDDFMLDRDENAESSYDKLNKLIGLNIVKKQIDNIIATDIVEKERKKRKGNSYKPSTMHMIFGGNPGTAKTTVAKLFAGIAKEKGILKSGAFVERGGMDLCGIGYAHVIRESFAAAKGGVLFIDEAYSITFDDAVTVLIQEMENHREDVIVILAGYNERMQSFMEINEGLKSRVPYWIDFPDYSVEELTDIFKLMLCERGFHADNEAVDAARLIFEKVRLTDNFGNGRYVRNLLERAAQNQSVRLMDTRMNVEEFQQEELFSITKEDIGVLDEGLKEERPFGTAKKELDEMIGLSSVKTVIRKALANFKVRKICMEKGVRKENASLHMVFMGNPGTAKTTVARLFAEIMKDERILPTGQFVEVGRAELVGDHVGSTAPLVKKRFREAQGGVLFIDEAYSLCDGYENGFGDEAINTIVQEMENHRDDVIVIFAGYPKPMQQFLDRNPGLRSRIAFHVNFEDYTTDELCEITKLMLTRKNMMISDLAMERLRNNYEIARESHDYGNGRYVRKVLEEAEMNLAERISQMSETEISLHLLTTIEEGDVPELDVRKSENKKKIGFCA